MKFRSVAFGLLLALGSPVAAWCQCSGQSPASTYCGNPTGAQALPGWKPLPAIPLAAHTYSPLSYGAVCNGSTDDAVAIAAAITALNLTGGELVLPNATCVSSTVQTIAVTAGKSVSVAGGGPDVSKVLFTSNTAHGFVFNVTPANGAVSVSGLSILNNTVAAGSAIKVVGGSTAGLVTGPSVFENLAIRGSGVNYADSITKGWAKGLDILDLSNTNVKTVAYIGIAPVGPSYTYTGTGIHYRGTSAGTYPVGLQVSQFIASFALRGLYVDTYVQGIMIDQSQVVASKQGFVLASPGGNQCSIMNSQTDTADEGIYISDCGGGVVQGNWVTGGRVGTTGGLGLITIGANGNSIVTSGNFVGGVATDVGIKVSGGWNITSNNTFANVGIGMVSTAGNVFSSFLYNINGSPGSTTSFSDLSGSATNYYIDKITPQNMGGFGQDVSASSGVPLFAAGTATFTPTTGTGDFVRKIDPVFPNTSALSWRNVANSANYSVLVLDGANNIQFGATVPNTSGIFLGGSGMFPIVSGTQDIGASSAVWNAIHHKTSVLYGSTSGAVTLAVAAVAGTNTLTFPAGTTNFSATGGTSQVVNQTSVGGAFTVARLACADLSDAGSGCSASSGITALTGDATATGPGSVVLTLATVNSNLGTFGSATQASQIIVNAKGLITAASNVTVTPAVGSITGLGTGVATALAVNIGTAGSFVVNGGALGTPSSGVATNLTGTASGLTAGAVAVGGITGLGTGVAAFLATPSSANLITSVTDETGSGALVFGTTPTLATPVINGLPTGTGVATASTASTLVSRDASKNFSAGNVTVAALTTAASVGATPAGTISAITNWGFTALPNAGGLGDYLFFAADGSTVRWTVSNAGLFSITGTFGVSAMSNTATTSSVCYNTGTGLFTYNSTVGTCTVSDERLKNFTGPIVGALDKLLQIKGQYFTWKDPKEFGKGKQLGVSAQAVEKVFPELVQMDSLGRKSADYQRLVAPIIEALREMKVANDNLRADVVALKKKVGLP